MLTTEQLTAKYGKPSENPNYLTVINLPYPMVYDGKKVTKMRCHKLVADKFLAVFSDILAYYGYDKIKELEIDVFGGCFNYRLMRGGTELSRHSWGVAIDFNPNKNTLKMNKAQAQFAKPEYKPMIDIFYKHKFINLGIEKGYDYMHFEISE